MGKMKLWKKDKNGFTVKPQPKPPRSIDDISKEYMQHACELGNIEYQLATLEIQKKTVVSKMAELSLESTMLQKELPNGEGSETTGRTDSTTGSTTDDVSGAG